MNQLLLPVVKLASAHPQDCVWCLFVLWIFSSEQLASASSYFSTRYSLNLEKVQVDLCCSLNYDLISPKKVNKRWFVCFLHYKFRPRPPKYFFKEIILLYVCDLHPTAAANVPLFWSQYQSIGHNGPPRLGLVWKKNKKIWCTKRSKSSENAFCSACSGFVHY